MKKMLSVLILTVLMVSCFSVSAAAAMPPTAELMWDNIGAASGDMRFSGADGTDGCADTIVLGKPGVTKIEGKVVVYKHVGSEWVYVTEASKTVEWQNCTLAVEFTGEHGYEYKAEFHFVVYKGDKGEVLDRTMTETCK